LEYVCIILCSDITLDASLNSLHGGRDKMKLITLYVPETYLKALDQLVGEKFYPNRAEAIRVAIRDLVNEEVWRRERVG
jgi:antitoxin ParD1/3/4